MNNSSTSTANFSNYKLLSALFLFVFLIFSQTASAQTHVIILKGNEKPAGNEIGHMLCTQLGGVFEVDIYNQLNMPMTNISATITMTDNYNNTSSLSTNLIPINPKGGMGGVSFPIPNTYPSSSGYFIISIQYTQDGSNYDMSQEIPFTICPGNGSEN